jgi:hypothetical protein
MGWNVITCRRLPVGLATAAVLGLSVVWAAEPPLSSDVTTGDESPPDETLAAYKALAASQAHDYDRRQDISPRQLLVLLEVSERVGASLGQALATGEHESARTWNDHVRPTLKSGNLGAATGVWQFMPATFHRIVKKFGARWLAASEADAAAGRQAMDLAAGPFTDTQVRSLIRETVDGQRGADDEQLQLLRHNFAVLAFAKHSLGIESGATTPEEDYLFHFLGEGQGRRILALARGEARNTLAVKPTATLSPQEPTPGLLAGEGALAGPMLVPGPDGSPLIDAPAGPRVVAELGPKAKPGPVPGSAKAPAKKPAAAQQAQPKVAAPLDRRSPVDAPARPRVALESGSRTKPGPTAGSAKTPVKKPANAQLALPQVAARPSIDVLVRPRVALESGSKTKPGPAAVSATTPAKKSAATQKAPSPAASGLALTLPADLGGPAVSLRLRGVPSPEWGTGSGGQAALEPASARRVEPLAAPEPALFYPMAPSAPAAVSSEWGLPADSPTVTGNLGMFYRDGKGQTQPYTWAEFLEHLGRRVRAADQPALVRAKYGVGFPLKGGDMPAWAFNPEQVSKAAEFRHGNDQTVLVPAAMITGTLDRDETRRYKERLAELVSRGEDQPLGTLPPESLATLHHLGLLDPKVQTADARDPQVKQALHDFRKQVGKDEPDDPEHAGRLMPAERVALELYEQRIARHAAVQAAQEAHLNAALDLMRIGKLQARFQRSAAPYIAEVQTALAERGLLTRPTQKTVWRDKKRKRHESYKTVPFAGRPDKATVAALNSFQLRHGLRQTDGVVDAVTLGTLGLPAMGPEVLLPPSGPRCAMEPDAEAAPLCEVQGRPSWATLGVFDPNRPRALPRILDGSAGLDSAGSPTEAGDSDVGECETPSAI